MSQLKENRSCALLEQYLTYLTVATTQIYTAVDNDQLQSAVNSNPLASMFGR